MIITGMDHFQSVCKKKLVENDATAIPLALDGGLR